MIQLVWLTLLAVHTGAAAVWWWSTPGGFPSSSTEYWVNQVAPLPIVVVLLIALFARGRFSEKILPPILATIPPFWLAFALSFRITFDQSSGSLWYLPFFGGAGLTVLWINRFRSRARPAWLAPMLALVAAWAGWSLPPSQRAPDATTLPSGTPFSDGTTGASDHKLVKLSKDAQLHPADGRVVIRRDKLVLNVLPLLSFTDRSPDRASIGMAPADQIFATTRTLKSKVHDAARWTLFYKDEDASVLEVTTSNGLTQLDARSRLPRPIFSHTNSYAELAIQGHQKLTVTFSPVPQKRIELAPATAPARFAYLDERGLFHIMQSAQRQRGPFTELAAGPMKRSDPLVITLYDGDKPAFTVTLQDWAPQASTQLSPTAGSGIAVNLIELLRSAEAETSPALISLSLAATSVGRGTQTVGHAAGVYRNRVTVLLPPQ